MIRTALVIALVAGSLSACSPALDARSVTAVEAAASGQPSVDHSGTTKASSPDAVQPTETRPTRLLRFSWREFWIWFAFFPFRLG
jgi:hypothetical protein